MTSHSLRPATLYWLFTISGACGLTYQVLWARWLSLVLGNTTASVSIVLSSFMLGLALGSWAIGRVLARVRRPLRLYGVLEAAIGAFAIAFPLLTGGAERLLTLIVDADSPRPLALIARAAVAFALLLLPTSLMGATLPLLAALLRQLGHSGRRWRLGLLYALNTTGAMLGSLLVSFAGIELLGIRASTLVAALLNLVVAALAIRADRGAPPHVEPAANAVGSRESRGASRLALAVLFVSGAAALASEVLWTRWLEVLVGNSSYAFALMLVVYLAGIAAGSALPSLFIARLRHLEAWLVATQLAASAWVLVAVAAFGRVATSLASAQHRNQTMATLLATYGRVALLLLPAALLSGAVFPLATRLLSPSADASGEVAARAYSWNTVGAVLGALLGGWVIAPRFDFAEAVLVLGVGYALLGGLCLLLWLPTRGLPRVLWAGLAAVALVLATTELAQERRSGGYPAQLARNNTHFRVLFHARGPQGLTTVIAPSNGDRFGAILLVNASGMTRLVTVTKLMAHLPLLAHPAPHDTLVICFGMGTTFRSAMSHGGRVTAVELVPEVLDAFGTVYPDADRVRADPRGRRVVDDGRNFLQLTRQRFDVITIDPPPPIDGAGVNHLHSEDFVRLARSRLRPGGIMAHWIPYPGEGAGVADWETFGMLVRSFSDAFPVVVAIPGLRPIGLHLLGSSRPIEITPERLHARLQNAAVAQDLNEWEVVPLDYFARLRPVDRHSLEGFPTITDDRPRLEFDLIRLWRAGTPKPFHSIFW